MSKFLKLLSENAPDKSQYHELLHELHELLRRIGFDCNKTENGVHFSVIHDEDDESGISSAAIGGALTVVPTAKKAPLIDGANKMVGQLTTVVNKFNNQLSSNATTI